MKILVNLVRGLTNDAGKRKRERKAPPTGNTRLSSDHDTKLTKVFNSLGGLWVNQTELTLVMVNRS